MKLFFVGQYIPYPLTEGATISLHRRVEGLRRKHEVAVFAPTRRPTDTESIAYLRELGWTIETVSRPAGITKAQAVWARVKALASPVPAYWVLSWDHAIGCEMAKQIERCKPDVVIIEHLGMSRFIPYIRKVTDAPYVLVDHNVEHIWQAKFASQLGFTLQGLLWRIESAKVRSWEKKALESAWLASAISDHDRELLQKLAPRASMFTLPIDVDTDYFSPDDSAEEERRVVFTAVLKIATNVDGAKWLAKDVYPHLLQRIPDAKVDLVGRAPGPEVRSLESIPGVSVFGDVPDVRPYIGRAEVVAVPVKPESGVRMKILDAFAMGKAVVSTTKGAEGLPVKDGENILLCDDETAFAEAIADLMLSPEKRKKLGQAARQFALGYSWQAMCETLDRHITARLEGSDGGVRPV